MITFENSPLALVTGAGRGMGASIARRLAEAGARVIVSDADKSAAMDTADCISRSGLQAHPLVLDVADPRRCAEAAAAVQQAHGDVALLVNNAGVSGELEIDDPGMEDLWNLHMAVNLGGVFHVTRAFVNGLRRTRGAVVNLASLASFTAVNGSFSYVASKGGVRLLTQSLAKELARDGIRVNAVAPGVIDTPMLARRKLDDAWMSAARIRTPLKRLGVPEEVADPVLFLLSPMARYITGVTLPVDGGYLAT